MGLFAVFSLASLSQGHLFLGPHELCIPLLSNLVQNKLGFSIVTKGLVSETLLLQLRTINKKYCPYNKLPVSILKINSSDIVRNHISKVINFTF
jgi:hypothetical protein